MTNRTSEHVRNTGPMRGSARCGAKTRSGRPCRCPSVSGKMRCPMHGGASGSGAPKANRNALKTGLHTRETRDWRRELSALARLARQTICEMG